MYNDGASDLSCQPSVLYYRWLTFFCGKSLGLFIFAAFTATVIFAGKFIVLGTYAESYNDAIFAMAPSFIPTAAFSTPDNQPGLQKLS